MVMSCISKNNLTIHQLQEIVHTSVMALAPARTLWPVSALHTLQGSKSLASSTHGNGAGLHTSINLCLLVRKPGQYNGRQEFQFFCRHSSFNVNHQKGDLERNRQSRFRDRTEKPWSERPNSQRKKYPWGEEEEEEELPWNKESPSPKKRSGPYVLKSATRTAVKRTQSPDEQNAPFYPSREGPQFGEGPNLPTAPWMQGWSNVPIKEKNKTNFVADDNNADQIRHFNGGRGKSAMHRIVNKLRTLGYIEEAKMEESRSNPGSSGEILLPDHKVLPRKKNGSLLEKSWSNKDQAVQEHGQEAVDKLLPWERGEENAEEVKPGREKRVNAPTLAELTIPDPELRRLRTLGMKVRDRIKVNKAGLTQSIIDKIHDQWKKSELVRLKFDETLARNMKRAHELTEIKTGGLVTWRAGSVLMIYRGSNYEPPSVKAVKAEAENSLDVALPLEDGLPFLPSTIPTNKQPDQVNRREAVVRLDEDKLTNEIDVEEVVCPQVGSDSIVNETKSLEHTEETEFEKELNSILDGLGPRFTGWWGYDPLPVDADLLPEVVPGYKTPFRLLPSATRRSKLTNAEMTNLRKLARPLPIHFALGRNKNLQGLAAAIVKLWERSDIAKIAVKRGVQNTNNEKMAEELKRLTGGVLLLRNKYFIIFYRGKDFVPPVVATALAERVAEAKVCQDEEENARLKAAAAIRARTEVGPTVAGTLAESLEAQAQWEMDSEEQKKMRAATAEARKAEASRRLQRKLAIAQMKKQKAERELAKVEALLTPAEQPADQETITNEERFMFRKLGLRMKALLMLGRRGVFDGVVENMHLHWKHRELVKIISKEKSLEQVEDTARMLAYESGGILVAVEKVSKGHAIVVYRGKNYQRPTKLRPQNLLNKRKALKRSLELQRRGSLSFHIYQLEQNIKQFQSDLMKVKDLDEEESNVKSFAELESETQDEDSEFEPCYSENEDISSESESEMNAIKLIQVETSTAEHIEKSNDLDPIFSAESLPNKKMMVIYKSTLNFGRPTLFSLGKNNDVSSLAMHISTFLQNHEYVKIGLKGMVTKIASIVHEIEEVTGAVLVSQAPSKIVLRRSWPEGQDKYSYGAEEKEMPSESITATCKTFNLMVDEDRETVLRDLEQDNNGDDRFLHMEKDEVDYDFVIAFQDEPVEDSEMEKEYTAHSVPCLMDIQQRIVKNELVEEDKSCSEP